MRRHGLFRLAAATFIAAGGVVGGGSAVTAASAHPVGHTLYFTASTSASAASFQFTQEPAASLITADLVNDSVGYTATAYDSSTGSEAQAASVFPGNLVVQGPSLLCSEGVLPFSCPVNPPSYPLLADASYPQHPRANAGPTSPTQGSKAPLVVHPAQSTATASATGATGDTSAASAGILPGTPLAISVGSEASHTAVTTVHHVLTVSVVSRASDISVGPLHIGAVTGRVVQRLVPGHAPVDKPSVTISDVTVAGHTASIGPKGLTVDGKRGPSLLHRLQQRHIRVEPVVVTRNDTRHGARSSVDGLVITASLPVKNTPYVPNPLASYPPFDQIPGIDANGTYVARVQLGAAGSAAAVQVQKDLGLGGLGPQPVNSATPPAGTSPPSRVLSSSHRTTRIGPVSTPGRNGAAPQLAPEANPPARGILDAFDLSDLYLALALGSATLFVAWRLLVSGRRRLHWPRRRPA